MSYIVCSMMSRFSSRKGYASTKGTKERLDKVGVIWWVEDSKSIIVNAVCKDRQQYEELSKVLSAYCGHKFPLPIDSADGSLTMKNTDYSKCWDGNGNHVQNHVTTLVPIPNYVKQAIVACWENVCYEKETA